MSRYLPSCLQLATVMVLLTVTFRGVSSRAFLEGTVSIRKAITDLEMIQQPWRDLCSRNYFDDNQNLSVDIDGVGCGDLNLTRLPNVIHQLEEAQGYVHFLEANDYEGNRVHFQTTNQPSVSVTDRLGVLIHHLEETMEHCTVSPVAWTRISFDDINDGRDVEFPRRVETILRNTRNFFTST